MRDTTPILEALEQIGEDTEIYQDEFSKHTPKDFPNNTFLKGIVAIYDSSTVPKNRFLKGRGISIHYSISRMYGLNITLIQGNTNFNERRIWSANPGLADLGTRIAMRTEGLEFYNGTFLQTRLHSNEATAEGIRNVSRAQNQVYQVVQYLEHCSYRLH